MRHQKVLLLFPDYKGGHFGALRPPAGLGYLAQALDNNGIQYQVCDLAAGQSFEDLTRIMKTFDPDLVGISIMTFMYQRSYEIIKLVKSLNPSVKIVAGGPHISTVEGTVLQECSEIDYGVILEGEEALIELCKGDPLSEIGGLIYRDAERIVTNERRAFISELDNLGFPRYEKFPLKRYVTAEIGIVSSRGCPYHCIYCPVHAAIGRRWRKRGEDSIVQEIQYWYSRGYRQFSILDDNFTLDKKRVLSICEKIQNCNFRDIELNCNNGVRADNVDYEILEAMKHAGFKYLAFGVEAGNNRILKNIGKGESLEIIEKAIQNALALRYKVTLFFLIGSPGETFDDIKDSIELATKYPVFDVRFYNLIPFPRSDLHNWVSEHNYFLVDSKIYLNNSSQWDDEPVFETPEMSRADRIKALKKVRQVRKDVRYRSMKNVLTSKFGVFSRLIAKIYVTDWAQNLLMKNAILRRNLKNLFQKIDKSKEKFV